MNKRMILKKDYEHYSFQIPFSIIFHNKKNNYICSELEKRQPCFSDDYCFDSKLKLKRNGFVSDVFVMNKSQLMEYKKNNPLGEFGFRFENDKKFYGFVSKKVWGLILGLFVLLISYIFFSVSKGKFSNPENEIITEKIENLNEVLDDPGKITKEILETIKNNHGVIRTFEWKCDGKNETVEINLENIYPEEFSRLSSLKKFSDIKYLNEIPVFTLTCINQIKTSDKKAFSKDDNFSSKMRNLLVSKNAELIEENFETSYVSFSFDKNKDFFSDIEELLESENAGVRYLSISPGKSDFLCVKVIFETNLQGTFGSPFSILEEYLMLFFKEKEVQKGVQMKAENIVRDSVYEKKEKVKIGEINKEGNQVIIFYKDENGKLSREVKNEK